VTHRKARGLSPPQVRIGPEQRHATPSTFSLTDQESEPYSPNPHRRALVVAKAELLPGTFDLLILKAVSLGALYPALYRLEHQGLLDTALRAQEA
jgi:hypothetical protein